MDRQEHGARATQDSETVTRALGHAQEARRRLREAAEGLDTARRWGIFDLLGGGWFASSRKHDRMDRVRSQVRRARRALNALGADCQALGLGSSRLGAGLEVRRDPHERAFDTWLDNPVTDLRVQQRIGNLRREVRDTLVRLERLVAQLLRLAEERGSS